MGGDATDDDHRVAQSRSRATILLWALCLGTALLTVQLLRLRAGPDIDLWLHLRLGAALRDGARFQQLPDPLVVIADRPYLPTQWLAEVAGSWVHDIAGVTGIHVLRLLALLAVLGLVQLTGRVWTTPVRSAGITLATVVATATAWGERPQLLGVALAAATVLLWTRTLRDRRPRWVLVPLIWVWAMCHGSWAVGVATGVVFLLALALDDTRTPSPWPRLVALVAATAVVPALTPLGPQVLLEPFVVGATARATVNEWQTPAPTNPLFVLVLLMAATVVVRGLRHPRLHAPELALAVAGAGLAAWSVRTVALGALLVAPALARSFAPRSEPAPPLARAELWPALAAAAVLALAPGVLWGAPTARPLPASVDRVLAGSAPGTRAAVDPHASGWVLWAHPQVTPLRDLRAEVYGPEVAEAYEAFADAEPGWQAYAAEHGVDLVVVPTGAPLDEAIAAEPGWRAVVRDDGWVVWATP